MEILVPIGNSVRVIRDALDAGADALYFGVRPNRSDKTYSYHSLLPLSCELELERAIRAARLIRQAGRRCYVALNAMLYDSQLDGTAELALRMHDAGAQAVIVADPGLAARLRARRPELELHVSIQGRVFNSEAALFWKDLGARRLILERVLSLEDIELIKRRTQLEVEVFVYGQFCFHYHGYCRLSSYYYGTMCYAPCRNRASIEGFPDSAGPYPLRSKQLNAYSLLPQIVAAGVDAIKIEGRLKGRRYVTDTLRAFRRGIDALERGQPLPEPPHGPMFLNPPLTTPGLLVPPECLAETLDRQSGRLRGLINAAPFINPTGLAWAARRTLAVQRTERDAGRTAPT